MQFISFTGQDFTADNEEERKTDKEDLTCHSNMK